MKDTWRFNGNELNYLMQVLNSGEVAGMSGSSNQNFERKFADKVNAKYGITFNSGTSTLHAALHALNVRAGDEVIVPALTVIANLHVIIAQGAVPIFADIDLESFNIDPIDVERKITERTKAIMLVPLYGLPCDYDSFLKISKRTGVPIINDAAQSPLAKYKGKDIASIFDITSFSFDATKHMSTGDGGMITTNSEETAVLIRKFGCLGYSTLQAGDGRVRIKKEVFQNPDFSRHNDIGLNYRMSEFQAAVGLAQLERLDEFIKLRQKIASIYLDVLSESKIFVPQKESNESEHVYWTLALRLIDKNITWEKFRQKFVQNGGSGVYAAWKLLYQEDVFKTGRWMLNNPNIYKNYKHYVCENAELVQGQIMQFPLNDSSVNDAMVNVDAFDKTLRYFS